MLVVGLTGGIGSGKTTVSALFEKLGVPVIDADVIARKVTGPNTPAFFAITTHFGQSILRDGQLDRQKLRDIIFNDPKERQWLENILHPLIEKEMAEQLARLSVPYCILSIPLLLEVTPYSFIDRILVVDVEEEEQIKRVMQRDHVTREAVTQIMVTQLNRHERLIKAHDLIENKADHLALEKKVLDLHHHYLQMSG